MAAKVKKGDRVIVPAGRNTGAKGEVLKVIPAEHRVLVQGINVVKRHQKPGQMDPGGIKTFEAPIHVSNVAIMDPRDGKPTRVGIRTLEDGRKVRYAKRSGEVIDI